MSRSVIAVAIGALAIAACDQPQPTAVVPVFEGSHELRLDGKLRNAVAPLSGDQEVPLRETRATGNAVFHVAPDGLSMRYKLIVANIENVVASHIHVGEAGVNGPVVAVLFGSVAPGGGRTDGVLAEGEITGANLVGPLLGQPLSALVEAMQSGGAYVNVHTNDGVPPTNTGPGDFPGGEVRGQIR